MINVVPEAPAWGHSAHRSPPFLGRLLLTGAWGTGTPHTPACLAPYHSQEVQVVALAQGRILPLVRAASCPFLPGPPSGPVIQGGKAPGAPRTCGPEGELSGEMWPASRLCADPNLGRIQNSKNPFLFFSWHLLLEFLTQQLRNGSTFQLTAIFSWCGDIHDTI